MGFRAWLRSFFVSSYSIFPPELKKFEKSYKLLLELSDQQQLLIQKLQKENLEWMDSATFWAQQLVTTVKMVKTMAPYVPEEILKQTKDKLTSLYENSEFRQLMKPVEDEFTEDKKKKRDNGNESPNVN